MVKFFISKTCSECKLAENLCIQICSEIHFDKLDPNVKKTSSPEVQCIYKEDSMHLFIYYSIVSIPTAIILDEKRNEINRFVGWRKIKENEKELCNASQKEH